MTLNDSYSPQNIFKLSFEVVQPAHFDGLGLSVFAVACGMMVESGSECKRIMVQPCKLTGTYINISENVF